MSKVRCPSCDGYGETLVEQEDGSYAEEECVECKGKGWIEQYDVDFDERWERYIDEQIDWRREESFS